ncbi:hypothetical protein BsIDN1_07520 [Bacillus safensis]|uniref:Uncharacterized protein n=1 Tax=Bacillus safensis TaxID=561879 RepID=A0A5S9M4P5_BACIA|nr:hypothetical protein BsIDN1_07520 [Bacillus safensis]
MIHLGYRKDEEQVSQPKRKLKLGVFIAGTGHHVASWRHPNAVPDAAMNLDYF